MDLLYQSFMPDDENEYMLNLLQVVRICWRDKNAPHENLQEFYQRFQQHLQQASAHYGRVHRCTSVGITEKSENRRRT